MDRLKNIATPSNSDEDEVKLDHSYIAGMNSKWYRPPWKVVRQFLMNPAYNYYMAHTFIHRHFSQRNQNLSSHQKPIQKCFKEALFIIAGNIL